MFNSRNIIYVGQILLAFIKKTVNPNKFYFILNPILGVMKSIFDLSAIVISMQAIITAIYPGNIMEIANNIIQFFEIDIIISDKIILYLICSAMIFSFLLSSIFTKLYAKYMRKLHYRISVNILGSKDVNLIKEYVKKCEIDTKMSDAFVKICEGGLFCLVILSFLSIFMPLMAFFIGLGSLIIIFVSVISRKSEALLQKNVGDSRREYILMGKKRDLDVSDLNEKRLLYLSAKEDFLQARLNTGANLIVIDAVFLTILVIMFFNIPMNATLIAMPILVVLSVRRILSYGRSVGAQFTKLFETRLN